MIDPDQDLATILAAFQATEPPPGIERRILDRLTAHAQTAQPATFYARQPLLSPASLSFIRIPQPGLVAFAGLAAAALLAALLPLATRRHLAPHPSSVSRVAQPARTAPPARLAHTPPIDASLASANKTRSHLVTSRRTRDSLLSVSFPAPPLPLTPQEKLLLRVAHARNPRQSPVLNPDLRASLAARDDESFQIFFAPATTIKPYEPAN